MKVSIILIMFLVIFGCKKNTPQEPIPATDTVTDIDGNVYNTVKIGDQVWMAENLKVTRYRNGNAIPNVTDSTAWTKLTTGAYCAYDNDNNNVATYGLLYNWYAVNDSRKITPSGWHVPTDEEWETLVNFLGGEEIAGDKLRESGTAHWWSPNTGASNVSGFTALPGGSRDFSPGYFYYVGNYGFWWSASAYDAASAWVCLLGYDQAQAYRGYGNKQNGFSVRCVRD